jgi:hypothetical protein
VGLALLSACGGGSGGRSGVGSTRPVNALTPDERNQVCDWFAAQMGGYGSDPCPTLGLGAPLTQADCVAAFPTCSVPVGQLEACVVRLIEVESACTSAAESAAVMSMDCQTVAAPCFAF